MDAFEPVADESLNQQASQSTSAGTSTVLNETQGICLFSITLMFRVFMELQPLHITKFWWSLSA
jgi:hypothetical protein